MDVSSQEIAQIADIVSETGTIRDAVSLFKNLELREKTALTERCGQIYSQRGLEIACGLGLPSLFLSTVKNFKIKAYDADINYVSYWIELSSIVHPGSIYSINSFYAWKQEWVPAAEMQNMLILDQARSLESDDRLENNILRWGITKGCDFAIVPFPSLDASEEAGRTARYIAQLGSLGYEVRKKQVNGIIPQALILAEKK
ncbi:MAG: hypothetical protein HGA85_06620 [Nanoarchaeota archaeon]|nr:hypothetical protein [Nanoarchaeota archaeon]